MTEYVKVEEGRFDEIERVVFERYLLELMRGFAAEEERLSPSLNPVVREINLVKPGTSDVGFQFRIYDSRVDEEETFVWPLYEPEFEYDDPTITRHQVRRTLGDRLMHLRGG